MEKRFTVEGTYEDIQNILQDEFDMTEETAQIAANILVLGQNHSLEPSVEEQKELWNLNSSGRSYETPLFKIRYTINFTQAGLDALDDIILSIIIEIASKNTLLPFDAVVRGVYAVFKNCYHVKKEECCVYFQVLNYMKKHSAKWISPDCAMPPLSEDRVCVNLDKKWDCPFRCGENNEKCSITLEKVVRILQNFCKNKVMVPSVDDSLYAFKL